LVVVGSKLQRVACYKISFSTNTPGFVGVTALFESVIGKNWAKMYGYPSIRRIDLKRGS
jgi:hypothetical protein